jgi:hypothetical protein
MTWRRDPSCGCQPLSVSLEHLQHLMVRWGREVVPYVVRHPAHQLRRQLMEMLLEIHRRPGAMGLQGLDRLFEVLREGDLSQHPHVGIAKEMEASFALHLPEVAVGIDNAIPCVGSVPGAHQAVSRSHLPNRSLDRRLKKSPLAKMPSFLKTYSRFFGSLITTPGGKDGTEIWNVSNPNCRSHFTNQENNLWRAWRKRMPFPTSGSVFGGRLRAGQPRYTDGHAQ